MGQHNARRTGHQAPASASKHTSLMSTRYMTAKFLIWSATDASTCFTPAILKKPGLPAADLISVHTQGAATRLVHLHAGLVVIMPKADAHDAALLLHRECS